MSKITAKISSDEYFYESPVMGQVRTCSYAFGEGDTIDQALEAAIKARRFYGCSAVEAVLEVYTPEQKNIVNHPKEIIALCRHKNQEVKQHYLEVDEEIKQFIRQRVVA